MRRFDAIVVGAGPAGLSAAARLAECGSTLLVDAGRLAESRDRDDAEEVLSGVGGAGLFSDGKYSFYPSGTAVWQLPHRRHLQSATLAIAKRLMPYGIPMAAGPRDDAPLPSTGADGAEGAEGAWHEKHYPSHYLSFETRLSSILAMWRETPAWDQTLILDARRTPDGIELAFDRGGVSQTLLARHVVVATGRWSPRWIRSWLEPLGVQFAFRRVEVGVRLEMRADHPFFARLPGTDGKLTFRDGSSEIRTFCTCRDGEVILGRAHGLAAFSGRADGPRTGRSNIGLVVRSTDEAFSRETLAAVASSRPLVTDTVSQRALAPVVGMRAAAAIEHAFERLLAWEPALAGTPLQVYAPCLEGVGEYPVADGNLEAAPGVWLAGDVQGRFRGIVASMISGHYVAEQICERSGSA